MNKIIELIVKWLAICSILFLFAIGVSSQEYLISYAIITISAILLYFIMKFNREMDEVSGICENIKISELHNRIQLEAYYIAERDGFQKHPDEYWRQAEEFNKNAKI